MWLDDFQTLFYLVKFHRLVRVFVGVVLSNSRESEKIIAKSAGVSNKKACFKVV